MAKRELILDWVLKSSSIDMKNVFVLFILFFFSFRGYALNDDNKAATSKKDLKVRETTGNMFFDPPSITANDNKDSFCAGRTTVLTAIGGDGNYEWFSGKDRIEPLNISNKLIVNKAGDYWVKSTGIPSNNLVIRMYPTPTKPKLTFIE